MPQMYAALLTLRAWIAARTDAETERGAAMVEYGLLVGLIAVASVVVIGTLGDGIAALFQDVVDALPD
jgi:pilus assembly protein Flp/PilA